MKQMNKNVKRAISTVAALMLTVLMLAGTFCQAYAADTTGTAVTSALAQWPAGPGINCDYACLMAMHSGAILYNENMDQSATPASLTKIMTVYLAIKNGNLDDQVTMTETGVALAYDGSANLNTVVGETFTLRDMLYGIALVSANDMATQVAEYIGGSVENFVNMMNQEAAAMGCKNTSFKNPSGMPQEGHLTTAHDLAIISAKALENENFRQIVSAPTYTIPGTSFSGERALVNHHPFMNGADSYEGVMGGKTGRTDLALNTLATFATKSSGRVQICIVMHADGLELCQADTKAVLDYGFNNFTNVQATDNPANVFYGGTVTVPNGATADNVEQVVTDVDHPSAGALVQTKYYLNNHYLGQMFMRKEVYNAVNGITPTPDPNAAPVIESGSLGAESEVESQLEAAAGESAVEEVTSGAEETEPEPEKEEVSAASLAQGQITPEEEMVSLPFGIRTSRTAFIWLAVLSAAVLFGIIAIIITLAVKHRQDD